MRITGDQVKAARLLLGWKQLDVAAPARVSRTTVAHLENDTRPVSAATVAEIKFLLEQAGVEFTNGGEPGVKLRRAAK
jgi:transcriptional regulator with XRE-family HTH domain